MIILKLLDRGWAFDDGGFYPLYQLMIIFLISDQRLIESFKKFFTLIHNHKQA